jgi:general secretion pathway protein K
VTVRGAAQAASRQRGIALILVLWVLTLLTIIAGSFAVGSRTETVMTGNSLAFSRAQALADAGVHRAIYELLKQGSDAQHGKGDRRAYQFSMDGAEIHVVILDEAAKIDLNTATDTLLQGLLQSGGIEGDQAAILLEAILDWRDEDDLPRTNGAEIENYRLAGLNYEPSNGPFGTVEELRLVLGMTPELYSRISGALTVHSRLPGINSAIAEQDVLLAIPGASQPAVEEYLALRQAYQADGLEPPPFPMAGGFESGNTGTVYNLRAKSTLPDGFSYVREAVIRLTGDPRRPHVFLSWAARPAE